MVKKKNQSQCNISSICRSEKSHIPEFSCRRSYIRYFISLFPRKTRFVTTCKVFLTIAIYQKLCLYDQSPVNQRRTIPATSSPSAVLMSLCERNGTPNALLTHRFMPISVTNQTQLFFQSIYCVPEHIDTKEYRFINTAFSHTPTL